MVGDVTLAGFRLTFEEWEALDDESKMLLLRACAQTAPQRSEKPLYDKRQIEHE